VPVRTDDLKDMRVAACCLGIWQKDKHIARGC
jgi:hypothetical protein